MKIENEFSILKQPLGRNPGVWPTQIVRAHEKGPGQRAVHVWTVGCGAAADG
jgi:hypothetical protein